MKAFLTRCSASSSHSLIEIALLVSLGIFGGVLSRETGLFEKQRKNTFLLILCVLGWSKLLDLDWWSQKFPRMDSLDIKQTSMLDRTLTTPITTIKFSA